MDIFIDLVNFAYMVKFGHKGIHAYCIANKGDSCILHSKQRGFMHIA